MLPENYTDLYWSGDLLIAFKIDGVPVVYRDPSDLTIRLIDKNIVNDLTYGGIPFVKDIRDYFFKQNVEAILRDCPDTGYYNKEKICLHKGDIRGVDAN